MTPAPALTPFVPGQAAAQQLLRLQRRHAIPVVLVPFFGLGLAVWVAWGWGVGWLELALLAVLYVLSMAGITVGYHRLLTHRSFECPPAVKGALLAFAAFAGEGPPLFWVATHRKHHQHSDEDGDPHSPYTPQAGLGSRLRALAHAHVGWMFTQVPANPLRYSPDLFKDRVVLRMNGWYARLLVAGLVLPGVVAGGVALAQGRSAGGALLAAASGFLWGGLVRLFLVQHVTWCINSVCHVAGAQPHQTGDQSRNTWWLALLSLGESWHNNHHAFPTSAAHGLSRGQLDPSWLIIRALRGVGLATAVKLPSAAQVAKKRSHDRPVSDGGEAS